MMATSQKINTKNSKKTLHHAVLKQTFMTTDDDITFTVVLSERVYNLTFDPLEAEKIQKALELFLKGFRNEK